MQTLATEMFTVGSEASMVSCTTPFTVSEATVTVALVVKAARAHRFLRRVCPDNFLHQPYATSLAAAAVAAGSLAAVVATPPPPPRPPSPPRAEPSPSPPQLPPPPSLASARDPA